MSRSQASGSSPQGKRDSWSTNSQPRVGCGARTRGRVRGPPAWVRRRLVGSSPGRPVPALAASSSRRRRPRRAGRRAPGRDRAVAGGVARTAHGGRCRRRRPRPAARRRGRRQPAAARPRRGRGCRRRGQPAPQPGRDDLCRAGANASSVASRSCRPLPTTPRRSSDETISGRAVALHAPRSTCPRPTRRPARRAPGRGSPGSVRNGVRVEQRNIGDTRRVDDDVGGQVGVEGLE